MALGTRRPAWSRRRSSPRAGSVTGWKTCGAGRIDAPPSLDAAGEILDELAAGWSQPAHRRHPDRRAADLPAGLRPADRLRRGSGRAAARGDAAPPGDPKRGRDRSNLDNLVLHRRDPGAWAARPRTCSGGSTWRSGLWGPSCGGRASSSSARSTQDDPLYKYVLREYVGYVLEKRFNLSWSIEGTRSRTRKMLPPRLGLLPTPPTPTCRARSTTSRCCQSSITFDQLHEISEYADYARGAQKKPEASAGCTASSRRRAPATTARSTSASVSRSC